MEFKSDLQITLRKAVPADAVILRHWDGYSHVMESDPNDDWNWEIELLREPSWRVQFMATLQNRPLGFIQIIDPAEEESHYWGDIGSGFRAIDIWIGEPEDLGKGFGTQMMTLALNYCFEQVNVTAVWIDPLFSNTRAIQFYQRLGFQHVENKYFGEDYCYVMRIWRHEWEVKQHSMNLH